MSGVREREKERKAFLSFSSFFPFLPSLLYSLPLSFFSPTLLPLCKFIQLKICYHEQMTPFETLLPLRNDTKRFKSTMAYATFISQGQEKGSLPPYFFFLPFPYLLSLLLFLAFHPFLFFSVPLLLQLPLPLRHIFQL